MVFFKLPFRFASVGASIGLALFAFAAEPAVALKLPAGSLSARAPKPVPTPPFANGDTFQYAITDTSVVTVPGQPPQTNVTTATASETVLYPYTYGSIKNTYLLTTTQQDTSDPNGDVEQDVVDFKKAGALYLLEYLAGSYTLYSGSQQVGTQSLVNKKPYDITAEYPESAGLQWNDNFATDYTFSENFGTFSLGITESQQADGSYTEVQTTSGASGQSKTEWDLKPNGTGFLLSEQPSQPSQKYLIGLPVLQGSGEVIPVKLGKQTTDVPDWYPGGGAPLSPLLSYTDTVGSLADTPSTCGAEAGQPAYDVHQVGIGLDPVGGEYVVATTDQYDSPTQGMICLVHSNQFTFYDNLNSGQVTFTEAITDVEVLSGERISPAHSSARAPVRAMLRLPARLRSLTRT